MMPKHGFSGLVERASPVLWSMSMRMSEWIRSIFDSPSRRKDADYSKEISHDAIVGVLLLYREFTQQGGSTFGGPVRYGGSDRWLPSVIEEMTHLYHLLIAALDKHHINPLGILQIFLTEEATPSEAFLDFLEISFRNQWAPHNDDFVTSVNHVLEAHDSPYLLTPYAYSRGVDESGQGYEYVSAYPRAYLKQESVVQKESIEPALGVLSDPAYEAPAKDFRKALARHRTGDYDGCVTACSASVEGTIKVAADKLRWRKVKGNGLGKLAQSFVSRSSLPDKLHRAFSLLEDFRSTDGDAHGHADESQATEAVAKFFIGWAATLILLIGSETR